MKPLAHSPPPFRIALGWSAAALALVTALVMGGVMVAWLVAHVSLTTSELEALMAGRLMDF